MVKRGKYSIVINRPTRAPCGVLCANKNTLVEHVRYCERCLEQHEFIIAHSDCVVVND